MSGKRLGLVLLMVFALLAGNHAWLFAAPKPELWPRWEAHDPGSTLRVDHAPWGDFLKEYLVTDDSSGINRVKYSSVIPDDRKSLESYLAMLQEVPVSRLNRPEQKAYWINLYNALTVKVVLDHYPVRSIRDIDISPGWFSIGPWDAKLVTIEGQKVSLNDIEHRILRPIWKDNRVHYALNCASLGCPNLQPEPFTVGNSEGLLEKGTRDYINHPRGAKAEGDHLLLSSIYDWYQVDFGGSRQGVIRHLLKYADPPLAEALKGFRGGIDFRYDWRLNDVSGPS